jgi:hypothetical protein
MPGKSSTAFTYSTSSPFSPCPVNAAGRATLIPSHLNGRPFIDNREITPVLASCVDLRLTCLLTRIVSITPPP